MRGLYAIVDHEALQRRGLDVARFAHAILEARPAALQLRAKNVPPREVLALLRAIGPACRAKGVPLVANDRIDLAVLGACDMVHVGQTDAPPEQIRGLASKLRFGISTHTGEQLAEALAASPLYVAYGPVFVTASKEGADPVVGLEGLASASRVVRAAGSILVAIGGITLERAPAVAKLADMGAVIADLLPPMDLAERAAWSFVSRRAAALHEALCGTTRLQEAHQ